MSNSNPESSCATAPSLALLLASFGVDHAAAQERPRLPSSFDTVFADVGRLTPLLAQTEVIRRLPPRPAAPENSGPGETASVLPPAPATPSPIVVDGKASSPPEVLPAEGELAPRHRRRRLLQPSVAVRGPGHPFRIGPSLPDRAPDSAPRGSPFLGSGHAVWYQHPGRSASGAIYNPDGLTAARRNLPMGAQVRVVSERNGRSVVACNDRTPDKLRDTFDLRRGSARALGSEEIGSVALYEID